MLLIFTRKFYIHLHVMYCKFSWPENSLYKMKHTNRQINSRNKCSHAANSGFAAHSEFVHHNQQQHSAALYAHHYNEHNHILTISMQDKTDNITNITTRDVKRLSVYRLSFIFLVLVFEFQKPIIVSSLALSSSRLKEASPRSAAIGRLVSLTHWHALAGDGECRRSTTANDR